MKCTADFTITTDTETKTFSIDLGPDVDPNDSFTLEQVAKALLKEDSDKRNEIINYIQQRLTGTKSSKNIKKLEDEKYYASTHSLQDLQNEFNVTINYPAAQVLVLDKYSDFNPNLKKGKYILPNQQELYIVRTDQVYKLADYLNVKYAIESTEDLHTILSDDIIKTLETFIADKAIKAKTVKELLLHFLNNPNTATVIVNGYHVNEFINDIFSNIRNNYEKRSFNNPLLTQLYRRAIIPMTINKKVNYNKRVLYLKTLIDIFSTRLNYKVKDKVNFAAVKTIKDLDQLLITNLKLVKKQFPMIDFNNYKSGSLIEYILKQFNDPDFNYQFSIEEKSIVLKKHELTLEEKDKIGLQEEILFKYKESYRSYHIFEFNNKGKKQYHINKFAFVSNKETSNFFNSLEEARAEIDRRSPNAKLGNTYQGLVSYPLSSEISISKYIPKFRTIELLDINIPKDVKIVDGLENCLASNLEYFYNFISKRYSNIDRIKQIIDSAEKAILFIYKYSELKPNGGTIDDVLDLIQNAHKRYYCVSNTIMQSGKTITKLKEINIAPLKHEQVKSNIGKHFAAIQTFFSNLGVKVNFVNEFDKDLFNFEISTNAKAFVRNGEIYINMSAASPADLAHEYLHLILGALRVQNIDAYIALMEQFSTYNRIREVKESIKKTYPNLADTDLNEEAFVRVFGDYINGNISQELDFNRLTDISKSIFNNFKGDTRDLYSTNADLAFTQFCDQIKELVSKKSNSGFLTQNNKVRAAINFIEKGIKEEFIKEVCK